MDSIEVQVSGGQGIVPSTYKTIVLKPNIVNGKNMLTQAMFAQTDTKYVIKYDYIINDDIVTESVQVLSTNVSQCVNPAYTSALAAYNEAHDAWIDADNAYTNNPNDTTLAAKNTAYATYTAAQTTLNNTPQYYYYAAKAINLHKGQRIIIPDNCVLLNNSRNALAGFEIAPVDSIVYIGSLILGTYEYTVQEAIQIPARCLIEFDGGSISNGTLVGNNTILVFDQEEEIILKSVELLGDFEYSAGGSGGVNKKDNVNGMATITLKKNKSFASQLTQTNTIYRIMYDYDLGGESVTIPENCVLQFDGGSLSNGTLNGDNTVIQSGLVKIFNTNIILAGSWNVGEMPITWFGVYPNTNIDYSTIATTAILKCLAANIRAIYFPEGHYNLSINLDLADNLNDSHFTYTALTGGKLRTLNLRIHGDGKNTIFTSVGNSCVNISGLVDSTKSYGAEPNKLIEGVYISDLTIDNKRTNKNGISLCDVQEFHLNNVLISCVYGTALDLCCVMDSTINNCYINDCSISNTDVNGNVPYNIRLTDFPSGYRCNAIKMLNNHFEGTGRLFYANRCDHLYAVNTKYEMWVYNDSTEYPPIFVTGSQDVVFDNFHFIVSNNPAITDNINDFKPLIKNIQTGEITGLIFKNMCISPTDKAFKVIDSNSSWIEFENCLFYVQVRVAGEPDNKFPLELGKNIRLLGCQFLKYDGGIIYCKEKNNTIENCNFISYDSTNYNPIIEFYHNGSPGYDAEGLLIKFSSSAINKNKSLLFNNVIKQYESTWSDSGGNSHTVRYNTIPFYTDNNGRLRLNVNSNNKYLDINGYKYITLLEGSTFSGDLIQIEGFQADINVFSEITLINRTSKIFRFSGNGFTGTTFLKPNDVAMFRFNDTLNTFICSNVYSVKVIGNLNVDGYTGELSIYNNRLLVKSGASWKDADGHRAALERRGNNRPDVAVADAGFEFFDESLTPPRPIWWTGSAWVDATGAKV